MTLSDDRGRSRVQEWIDERAKSKEKRDGLCNALHGLIFPIVREWVAQRTGSDPITGNQVFSLREGPSAERDPSSAFIPSIVVEAFDGSLFECCVPAGRAVIHVAEPVCGERDFARIVPANIGEGAILESEDGTTVSVHALLSAFEEAVLQSPIW